MAKSKTTERDEKHELSRRALIKWTVAAGAALGVSRSKVFDILEGTAGKGVAQAAAANPTRRHISVIAGNGGLAWFQLLWPQNDVAAARNAGFAWHKIGQETLVTGTDKPLTIGPDTPFAGLAAQKQMTNFLCGRGEAHVSNPVSTTTLGTANILAAITALQAPSPSVIPVVTIGDADLGTAQGSQRPANVGDANGIVGLFNSAASRANGLLSNMDDANLYKAHYDAFIQLNRAANRSTTKTSYTTASGAAQFLGTNLASKLQITDADRTRYGIDGNTRNNVKTIGEAFIVSVKAFKMGLTNSVLIPALRDDPHGAFANGDINVIPPQLKLIFDGLMNDLNSTVDDSTLVSLGDDTVISICGDTPKQATDRNAWPDGPDGNANMLFIYSAGQLKTGWFGGVKRDGTVRGFGTDGNDAAYNGANTAKIATAALAYAVAKGDDRAISQFANGIQIAGVFGNIKDQ